MLYIEGKFGPYNRENLDSSSSKKKTIFHKIQAVNIAGTVAVLLITVFGFLTNRPEFLDLALVYGLLNVIGTFSVLKFFKFGRLGEEDNKKEKI